MLKVENCIVNVSQCSSGEFAMFKKCPQKNAPNNVPKMPKICPQKCPKLNFKDGPTISNDRVIQIYIESAKNAEY